MSENVKPRWSDLPEQVRWDWSKPPAERQQPGMFSAESYDRCVEFNVHICTLCGAFVDNRHAHIEWHKGQGD